MFILICQSGSWNRISGTASQHGTNWATLAFSAILYFVYAERSIGIIHKGPYLPIFMLLCIKVSVKTSVFKWGGSIFGQICVTSLMNVPYWVSSLNDIPQEWRLISFLFWHQFTNLPQSNQFDPFKRKKLGEKFFFF